MRRGLHVAEIHLSLVVLKSFSRAFAGIWLDMLAGLRVPRVWQD